MQFLILGKTNLLVFDLLPQLVYGNLFFLRASISNYCIHLLFDASFECAFWNDSLCLLFGGPLLLLHIKRYITMYRENILKSDRFLAFTTATAKDNNRRYWWVGIDSSCT